MTASLIWCQTTESHEKTKNENWLYMLAQNCDPAVLQHYLLTVSAVADGPARRNACRAFTARRQTLGVKNCTNKLSSSVKRRPSQVLST